MGGKSPEKGWGAADAGGGSSGWGAVQGGASSAHEVSGTGLWFPSREEYGLVGGSLEINCPELLIHSVPKGETVCPRPT